MTRIGILKLELVTVITNFFPYLSTMKLFPVFLLFVFQFSFGQKISTTFVKKIPLEADEYIGTDNYANIYYLKKNVFYKKETDKTYQFSDLQLGGISSVDIINPLKITLFYEDVNTVVFLDRHLIEISRIRFNTLPNFRTLGFASTAGNNSLWIFNRDTQQLEVFDYLKKEALSHSQPIENKVIDQKSNFNFCWLLTEKTLEQYNSYGSLIRKIPNENFVQLTENNGDLVVKKEDELYFLKKAGKEFFVLELPKIDVKAFYLKDENLYFYNGKFIHEYQINLTN